MQDLQTWQIVAICVAVVIIVAAIAWTFYSRRRTVRLRQRFGPEYDRTLVEAGSRRRAEAELAHREARLRHLRIQPLNVSDRQRFVAEWRRCQTTFVDDPGTAVREADALIDDIMHARGYTAQTRPERFDEISAAYPDHAAEYREACEIAGRYRRGDASTEDLRKAFLSYRGFFDELLEDRADESRRAA